MFYRHGGRLHHIADILGNKNMLQKDLAAFYKFTRDVFCHTCPPEHEWIIKPSYARTNRLNKLYISDKHASINGMPNVTDEENAQIVKRVVAMRGIHAKKQQTA